MQRRGFFYFVCSILCLASPARAAFHLWNINEIYSNNDGSVQFIELFTTFNSQQFTSNHEITTNAPPQFFFPSNTPSPTGNHHLLLATEGFSAVDGSVAPDFIIPDGFFDPAADTINFVGADSKTFASLPTDGVQSINYPGGTIAMNSPTNYAGDVGSLVVRPPPIPLQAGDADQNLQFDQFDVIKVLGGAKYLTGLPATWGEGDWDGAPGGSQGDPPAGNGVFDQFDLIAAQRAGLYLTGPYAAVQPSGVPGDEQTSLVYDANTGELSVDAPSSTELTSIFVTSAGDNFVGTKPPVLDGPFDSFGSDNIFKSTIGGSFGNISFGAMLPPELSEALVASDLSASGSLAGGGGLGDVDLVYLAVPEPSSMILLLLGAATLWGSRRNRGR